MSDKPKVLICVLCGPERYEWITPWLTLRLIEATHAPNVDVQVRIVFGTYGYATARNRAIEEHFLPSEADFVCLCDNDNVPPADFVSRVMEFAQSRPDADVIALPYYIRPALGMMNTLLCTGWRHSPDRHDYELPFQLKKEWREVDGAGAGCMFIKRAVLLRLGKPWFQIPERMIAEHFVNGAGEDFDLCERAKALGMKVWTHGGLLCDHLHTVSLSAVAKQTVVRDEEDTAIFKQLGLPTCVSSRTVEM